MGIKFNPLIFGGFDLSGGGGPAGAVQWKPPVADEASLPLVGNAPGDARVVLYTSRVYVWYDDASLWVDSNFQIGAFGGSSPEGLSSTSVVDGNISRTEINLNEADALNPGAVSTSAQTFAGDKTFNDDIIVEGSIDAKGGIDSSTNTLTIGATADNINIGAAGATVLVQSDILYVTDKNITINYGGAAASGSDAGIEIEENLAITGFVKVTPDRNSWQLKAPNQAGVATIDAGVAGITLDQSSHDPVTLAAVGSSPNADGATLSGQVLNLEPADSTNPGVVSTISQNFAGDKTFDDSVIIDGDLTAQGSFVTLDSPDVNIGQVAGTTDIIGTVTIEYNPANPTNWAPAPDDVIEGLDQLADRFVSQNQVTKEPTGFPNRTDSVTSFSDTSPDRTFTIAPTGVSFDFYVKGTKFTKTAPESIQLPNLAGNHYIYYTDAGVLSTTQTLSSSLFEDNALVSIVYWNTDTNTRSYFAEERHGLTMDGATHTYLHTVFGARYLSGLALQNFSVDGTGNLEANAQFDADQGRIRDEDLLIEISAQAQIPVLYRQGSLWRKKAADAFPIIYSGTAGYTGANGRLPYNQFTGGVWQLTEVPNNDFVLVHFFGTNDKDAPIVGIQGTSTYTNVTAARNAASTEITSLSGLPFAEFVAIGSVVFETADGYTNTPQARVRSVNGGDYVDFRGTQLYTPAGNATTHSLLSGLANDDHIQYVLADGTRSMSGDLTLLNESSVKFTEASPGTNFVEIKAPASLASDYTITLPTDDGINHQFAKTDGSGNLAWEFPKNNASIYHVSTDGRSEYTTIQSAINAAEADGAAYLSPKFVVVHGLFTEDLTISKSGIFLVGQTSQNNLLSRINGSLTINKLVNIPGEGATAAVIYVGGLAFTKTSDNFIRFTGTNPQRVTFEGCTLISSTSSVLLCDNTGVGSKVTVKNCTIQTAGVAKRAITMSNGWIDVRDSVVESTTSGAISISGADSALVAITSTEIVGQISSTVAATFIISISTITTASGSAIATTSSSYVAISNSGLSVPVGTNSVTGTGILYFADVINAGLGGGFASTVAAVGFTNDVGNLRLPNRGTIALTESLVNGQNTTTLQAASSIASNFTYTLPNALPSNNSSAIVSSSSGVLSYVYVTASSFGDISKASTNALNNQAVAQNITGLLFSPGTTNSFDAQICVVRDSTYAEYNIKGVYKTASLTWEMTQEYVGDDAGIVFSITPGGQMQYTSTNTGFNAVLYFRAQTV